MRKKLLPYLEMAAALLILAGIFVGYQISIRHYRLPFSADDVAFVNWQRGDYAVNQKYRAPLEKRITGEEDIAKLVETFNSMKLHPEAYSSYSGWEGQHFTFFLKDGSTFYALRDFSSSGGWYSDSDGTWVRVEFQDLPALWRSMDYPTFLSPAEAYDTRAFNNAGVWGCTPPKDQRADRIALTEEERERLGIQATQALLAERGDDALWDPWENTNAAP